MRCLLPHLPQSAARGGRASHSPLLRKAYGANKITNNRPNAVKLVVIALHIQSLGGIPFGMPPNTFIVANLPGIVKQMLNLTLFSAIDTNVSCIIWEIRHLAKHQKPCYIIDTKRNYQMYRANRRGDTDVQVNFPEDAAFLTSVSYRSRA